MQIGAVFSQADSGTDAAAVRQWAIDAEAAGFQHILAYDHILGATVDRIGPGPFGAFPMAPYTIDSTFHEIMVLFSYLAGATTSIEFVSSVVVSPQRQTALLAKQAASLDLLSGGRFRLAVGVGWNKAEYESLGVQYTKRTKILEEQIDVMRLLWTEHAVDYEGDFHSLNQVGICPPPTNPIPIYIGSGAAEPVLRRVVRKADGWLPLLAPGMDKVDLIDGVKRIREICEEEGRDPASLPIHCRAYIGGDGWERQVEIAAELGCAHFSLGFDRYADSEMSHAGQLETIIATKAQVDAVLADL